MAWTAPASRSQTFVPWVGSRRQRRHRRPESGFGALLTFQRTVAKHGAMRSDSIGPRSLRLTFIAALVFGLLQSLQSWADDAGETNAIHAPLLTVDRLFDGEEFREESVPEFVWSRHQPGYFTLARPRAGGGGRDLIRCDAATGRTNVILPVSPPA